MKLYKIIRMSKVGYDEFDSCVVIAEDEEQIHKWLDEKCKRDRHRYETQYEIQGSNYWDCGINDRKIEEIKLENYDKPFVLLSSFNAG